MDVGDGGKEHLGVGVFGLGEERFFAGVLYDLSQVHDCHIVTDVLDHRDIMGDKERGEVVLILEIHHEVEYLSLNRYIQCRDRLISQDKLWTQDDRSGDRDTLSLSSGELMRITLQIAIVYPHIITDLVDRLHALFFAHIRMDFEGLLQDGLDLLPRIERRVGVLEDHLDIFLYRAARLGRELGDILTVIKHLSAGCLVEPQDDLAYGGLATATLPYKGESFALIDIKIDLVECMELLLLKGADLDGKDLFYLFDFK